MTDETITATDNMAAARAAKAAKREAERRAAAESVPELEEITEAQKEKVLTPEEIETLREELLTKLADLPQIAAPLGAEPGTRIGEGLKADYVQFTPQWFTDVEARRKDRADNGTLRWPNYSLREMTPAKDETVTVQGVAFRLIANMQCKLPDPHYHAWLNSQKAARQNDIEFAKPETPHVANAMTQPHMMGVGPIRDRQT